MKMHILTIGEKMPDWVNTAVAEYDKRLSSTMPLVWHPLAAVKRGKNANVQKIKEQESQALLDAVPKGAMVIALHEKGQEVTTAQLADKLSQWHLAGQDVALLIGGPDGHADFLLQQVQWTWSLSKLTFPHPLVRVILAEQLYRAHSLMHNHPYHRE